MKRRVKSLIEEKDITKGKIYEVTGFGTSGKLFFKDDVGDSRVKDKSFFEEVKEPNYVMVRQGDCCKWEERILLHDLGEQFSYRYVVVGLGYEHDFINGKEVNCSINFKQMKPINEVERKIEELEQKLAELKQQLNK